MDRRGTGRWWLAAAALGAAALAWGVPAEAWTQTHVTWTAGGKFGVNANLLTPPSIIAEPNPPIPAFLGSGGGAGVSGELLWEDIVGLGLELWTVTTGGRGRYLFVSPEGSYRVEQELRASELQLPLMVRAQLPIRYARPYLSLGYTFIFQRSATYAVDAAVLTTIEDPEPQTYGMWTAALGVALMFEGFRFPIEVRGAWNPLERHPVARADWDWVNTAEGGYLTRLRVNAEWESQLWVMLGVQYAGEVDVAELLGER